MIATPFSRSVLLGFFLLALPSAPQAAPDGEKILFDFEQPEDLKGWANLELPNEKEPAAVAERSTENAVSGKHSLKITFKGGTWPAVACSQVPGDWTS